MDADSCREMHLMGPGRLRDDNVQPEREKKKSLRTTLTLKNHKLSCCLQVHSFHRFQLHILSQNERCSKGFCG